MVGRGLQEGGQAGTMADPGMRGPEGMASPGGSLTALWLVQRGAGSLGAEVRQQGRKETPNLAVSGGVAAFVFSGPAKTPVQKGPLILQFQSPRHLSSPRLSVAKSRERPGWALALQGFLVCLLSSPYPRPQSPFLTPIHSFPPSLPR